MAITEVQIATNAYAPEGLQAINLYSTSAASDLTLGQLTAAICIQAAAAMESESVSIMNRMNADLEDLDTAASYVKRLADMDDSDIVDEWDTIKTWLENTLSISNLPDDVSSYSNRMSAVETIGTYLSNSTQSAQEDMIDIQSAITARDVAFSTSSNIIAKLGTSLQSVAANF